MFVKEKYAELKRSKLFNETKFIQQVRRALDTLGVRPARVAVRREKSPRVSRAFGRKTI